MTASEHAGQPPKLTDATWLTRPETTAVFEALERGGHQARVVGGAVRNGLLGTAVTDVDFATTARPEEIVAAAKAAGLHAVPTGIEHGTVTVIAAGVPFEVTTLRRDLDTDGRHATVAFTSDWAADAARRDFTINALYVDRAGTVHDPVGGYPDLLARRIRFIGDATTRIREDYLRILRFFRFNARYGSGACDPAGLVAAVAERRGMTRLSGERVGQELLKLLAAPGAIAALEVMFDHGLLTELLPAPPALRRMTQLAVIEATLGRAADPVLRLGALTVEIVEDAERIADRLRLSNSERACLRHAAQLDPRLTPALPAPTAQAMLYRLGTAAWGLHVMLAWARCGADPNDSEWESLLTLPEREPPAVFPVRGADVLRLGEPPGPRVGEILSNLESWWIANGFPPDGAELRKELEHLVSEARR